MLKVVAVIVAKIAPLRDVCNPVMVVLPGSCSCGDDSSSSECDLGL